MITNDFLKPLARLAGLVGLGVVLAAGGAQAQSAAYTPSHSLPYYHGPTGQLMQAVGDTRVIVKAYHRQNIENALESSVPAPHVVTSRDRPPTSGIVSPAHNRGAIDFALKGTTPAEAYDTAARSISRTLGNGYTTIIERPVRPGTGRDQGYDLHTPYNAGVQVPLPHTMPPRAKGLHIHVQPSSGIKDFSTYSSIPSIPSPYVGYGASSGSVYTGGSMGSIPNAYTGK